MILTMVTMMMKRRRKQVIPRVEEMINTFLETMGMYKWIPIERVGALYLEMEMPFY